MPKNIDKPYKGLVEIVNKQITASQDLTQRATDAIRYLVKIINENHSVATGILITECGFIITNEHVSEVITPETKIFVHQDSSNYKNAKIIWKNIVSDLALIKIERNDRFTAAPLIFPNLAPSADIIKKTICALAFKSSKFERAPGLIEFHNIDYETEGAIGNIETNAQIKGGYSGGPTLLVDTGEIIGVTKAFKKKNEIFNFISEIEATTQLFHGQENSELKQYSEGLLKDTKERLKDPGLRNFLDQKHYIIPSYHVHELLKNFLRSL